MLIGSSGIATYLPLFRLIGKLADNISSLKGICVQMN